jgi:hypothetical protein
VVVEGYKGTRVQGSRVERERGLQGKNDVLLSGKTLVVDALSIDWGAAWESEAFAMVWILTTDGRRRCGEQSCSNGCVCDLYVCVM